MYAVDKSCPGPLRGAQTLTFGRRQVPQSSAGLGAAGARGGGGGTVSASLPSPFPSRRREGGGGARVRRGVTGSRYPGAGGLGSPPTAPGPLRVPGTGVTGWGMGPCRKKPPPLPLLSLSLPPFPSASAWEIWALQSHTRAKGGLLEAYFFKI